MSKKLFSLVALVAITFFINIQTAQAAVSDCASQGCFAVCTYAGPINLYFNNGTLAGTITGVGTGSCRMSAGEGFLFIGREDTIVRTYDVANETLYTLDIGQSVGYSTILNGYAYMTSSGDDSVKKIDLTCSGFTSISLTGDYPQNITHDGSTIYVINAISADISTISSPYTTSTTHSIGRVVGDMVGDVKYHSGNNLLYMAGLAGVYTVPIPLDGTSTLWQALPARASWIELTSTHLGVSSVDGNSAYLIPVATPSSYYTVACNTCADVAINDTTLYTAGANTPDLNVRAWNMSGVQESYSPIYTAAAHAVAWLAPTVTTPVCPNGTKETGEACDGTDFGTTTCQTLGFDGGTLTCTGTCTIDTINCYYNCGNGSIDSGEDCDGSNLNGQDCTDLGFSSGTLSCDANCDFVTTQCVSPTCGDSNVDAGEDCDGDNNGQTCESLGFDGGQLSCSTTSCTFDTSLCSTCGNNTLEFGEQCDDTQFGGETCQSQGFDGGTLSCTSSCTLDTSACTNEVPVCGDGVIDNGEQCDDNNTAAGDGCSGTCQIEDGYTCEGEPSDCSLQNTCNQDGMVTILAAIDDPDLQGAALERYQETSALPKGSTITCETTFGEEVIKVEVPAGHHENVHVVTPTTDVIWHLYDGAVMYLNTAPPYNFYVTSGGSIALHSGSDIDVKYESLGLGTLGTVWMARYLNTNPLTNVPGNWLELRVTTDRINLFAYEDSTNSVVLAAPEMDGFIYLNIDALGDLSEFFQPPDNDDPKGCCGCSISGHSGPTSLPIVLLVIFALLVVRRLKVYGSR